MNSPALLVFFLATAVLSNAAKAQTAPAPSLAPLNLTGILAKAGQYTTLIRLLSSTQVGNQIENQLNNSDQGITMLAPTDNAFNNLKPGTLNGLTAQQQVALVLYHVMPKFYTLSDLSTVNNPVRTQATGNDGGLYTLNFTGEANQVNVSTGIVETPVNNVVYSVFPLAIYEADKVLLPLDLFGAKPPAAAPPPTVTSKRTPSPSPPSSSSKGPTSSSQSDSTNAGTRLGGKSFVIAVVGLVFMGFLSL